MSSRGDYWINNDVDDYKIRGNTFNKYVSHEFNYFYSQLQQELKAHVEHKFIYDKLKIVLNFIDFLLTKEITISWLKRLSRRMDATCSLFERMVHMVESYNDAIRANAVCFFDLIRVYHEINRLCVMFDSKRNKYNESDVSKHKGYLTTALEHFNELFETTVVPFIDRATKDNYVSTTDELGELCFGNYNDMLIKYCAYAEKTIALWSKNNEEALKKTNEALIYPTLFKDTPPDITLHTLNILEGDKPSNFTRRLLEEDEHNKNNMNVEKSNACFRVNRKKRF